MTGPQDHVDRSAPKLARRCFITRVGGVAALTATGIGAPNLLASARTSAASPGAAGAAAAAPTTDTTPLELLKKMPSLETQNFGQGGHRRTHAGGLKSSVTVPGSRRR